MKKYIAVALIALSSATAIDGACAQEVDALRPSISVAGGVTNYDLSGTGDRRMIAVRAEWPLTKHFIVQPGVGYMNYRNQWTNSTPRWHVWFPEVQVQATLPISVLNPYIGAGVGAAVQSIEDTRLTEATLSVSGGLRVSLPYGFGIGGELRIRAVDPWHGTTADFAVSLARRL